MAPSGTVQKNRQCSVDLKSPNSVLTTINLKVLSFFIVVLLYCVVIVLLFFALLHCFPNYMTPHHTTPLHTTLDQNTPLFTTPFYTTPDQTKPINFSIFFHPYQSTPQHSSLFLLHFFPHFLLSIIPFFSQTDDEGLSGVEDDHGFLGATKHPSTFFFSSPTEPAQQAHFLPPAYFQSRTSYLSTACL